MLDNPTVVFYEDGSLLMASRGGKPGDEAWSDGIVTAPSWRGPYTQHSMIGNASSPRVEDPFLWRDTKGFYHVIFHKFTDEHPNCGGHAFSRDGFHWTLSNSVAFTTTAPKAQRCYLHSVWISNLCGAFLAPCWTFTVSPAPYEIHGPI